MGTLGELQGFIASQQSDAVLVAGDFNVDFAPGDPLTSLLLDFVHEENLFSCDLAFQDFVGFTYERDDGLVRSWIYHILCSQSLITQTSDVYTIKSGSVLSDHLPLSFLLGMSHLSAPRLFSTPSSSQLRHLQLK